jgi:hypothetical protein
VTSPPLEDDAQGWSVRIRKAIAPRMREADVDKLMAPYARDRAWVPLGGSGAKGVVFQLPSVVNAWFQLDESGKLTGYAVYEQPASWVKGPDGVLHGEAADPPPITFLTL